MKLGVHIGYWGMGLTREDQLAIVQEAEEVFATGQPKLLTYGISDDEGWNVGLPCGGEIDVFVEKVE